MTSAGELNLNKLLSTMAPKLLTANYVFCTINNAKYGDFKDAEPIACFSEDEGLTLVLTQQKADTFNFKYEGVFKGITLSVHSSLHAVGLTAIISNHLAKQGISANIIAGYYHDHVFVPFDKVSQAMDALQALSIQCIC